MVINDEKYEWENITIKVKGVELNGIKSIRYDDFKGIVEKAKMLDIELNYGAFSHLPASIYIPKNIEIDELFMIDLKNTPRDSWFKY